MLRRTRVDKITEFPKYLRKAKMLAPSVVDELDWTYKFSHPLVKRLPQFPHVIKELNSDYNEIALKQNSTKDSTKIVKKVKLQPKLNIKQMIEMEMDPRVLNRTKSMIESDLPSSLKRASGEDPKDCLRSLSCEEKIKHESDEEDQNSSDEFIDGVKNKFDLEDRANLQKSKLRTGGKKVFGLVGEKTLNPYKRRPEIKSILELYPKSDLPQVGGTVVNTEMNQLNDPIDQATIRIDHENPKPKRVSKNPKNKQVGSSPGKNKKGGSGPDKVKKTESGPDKEKKDESGPGKNKKGGTGPDKVKKTESGSGKDKKTEALPEKNKKGESNLDKVKKTESAPGKDKKTEAGPDKEKKGESGPEKNKKTETLPEKNKKGESNPDKVKKTESGTGKKKKGENSAGQASEQTTKKENKGQPVQTHSLHQ